MRAAHSRRNGLTILALVGLLAGMTGLVVASVPLYRLFCQATGYGGTTQRAEAAPAEIGELVMTVRFNTDVDPDLPWRFEPVERQVRVRVGEEKLAFFRARNRAGKAVTGRATFNVTPDKAGLYFNKVACFCFDEQRLEAGQQVDMPVSFFIDPAIVEDDELKQVRTITLSYTFFREPDDGAAAAGDGDAPPLQVSDDLRPRTGQGGSNR